MTATKTRQEIVESLAAAFCAGLEDYMGRSNLTEVAARNAKELCSGVCHSHDFCDANQVMLDAAESLDLTDENSLQFDGDWDAIIDEAWNVAKQAGFRMV